VSYRIRFDPPSKKVTGEVTFPADVPISQATPHIRPPAPLRIFLGLLIDRHERRRPAARELIKKMRRGEGSIAV